MSTTVIGTEDLVLGLRLAGAHGVIVSDAAEAREQLRLALREAGSALVLVDPRLRGWLGEELDELGESSVVPAVVVLPEPGGDPGAELDRMARLAVGAGSA